MAETYLNNKVIELLEEILKWVKFLGWRNVKDVLLDTLKDDLSKLIYHYSDGSSSRKIAEKLPVSHSTVTIYWKKWAKIGIVEPLKVKGGGTRYRKIFDLEDFGIELPVLENIKKIEKVSEDEH